MSSFEGTARYRPIRLIGAGGMGAVYEVEDVEREARVALKVMHQRASSALLRFNREFRAIAELRHAHLVRLHDLHAEGERWFYTMELIEGAPLFEALGLDGSPEAARGLDAERLVRLLAQILDALAFLHARGFIHRDLKPDNILVSAEDRVRLVDFGIIKDTSALRDTSARGEVFGTVAYMAPEQARGGEVGPAADLYALGCVLYHALAGALPFSGAVFQVMMDHQQTPAPDPRALNPQAPEALAELALALMSKDPAERPDVPAIRRRLGLSPDEAPASSLAEGFVGREGEIAALERALERARQPAGEPSGSPSGEAAGAQFVLIEGPSGAGKTALAEVIAARARAQGFEVFKGRCYEREAVPFRAFDRIMDGVALDAQSWSTATRKALRGALDDVARSFAAFEPGPVDDPPRSLGEQRALTFLGAGRLFDHLQRRAPLLLILDDLTWTDPESVEMLDALLEPLPPWRALLIGLARDAARPAADPLERFIERHRDRPWFLRLPLGPLDREATRALIERRRGACDSDLVDLALAQSEGNPLLLSLVVDHLDEAAPTEPSALMQRHLGGLGQAERQVMEIAAVAGGPGERQTLRLASGLDGPTFGAAVEALASARVLQTLTASGGSPRHPDLPGDADTDGIGGIDKGADRIGRRAGGATRLDFVHNRFREVTYEGLSAERRQLLHGRLADAIEARDGERADAEALLTHRDASGQPDEARRHLLAAADAAASKLAFERAARLVRRAIETIEVDEGRSRAARWRQLADLLESSGDLLAAAEALTHAREALEAEPDAPSRAEALGRVGAHLGANLVWSGEVARGEGAFERVLAPMGLSLARSYGQSLRVIAWLQLLLLFWSSLPEGWGRRPQQDEDRLRASVFHLLMLSVASTRNVHGAEYNTRLQLLVRRLEGGDARRRGLLMSGTVTAYTRARSAAAMARADAMAEQAMGMSDDPLHRADAMALRGTIHLNAARWSEAALTFEAALAAYRDQGAHRRPECMNIQVSLLLAVDYAGEVKRTESLARRMMFDEDFVIWRYSHAAAVLSRLLVDQGRLDEAREVLGAWGRLVPERPPTYMRHQHLIGGHHLAVAEGRFAEVLDAMVALEGEISRSGFRWLALSAASWDHPCVEAAIGAGRGGALPPAPGARARKAAGRMAHQCPDFMRCVGLRGVALLDAAAGRARPAQEALVEALRISADPSTPPRHRWLVLRAAEDLGRLDDAMASEIDAIERRHRFKQPHKTKQ